MRKSHILLYIAIITLAFTAMLGTTVLASTAGFTVKQSYVEGTFTDISASDWVYADVVQSYEFGFISPAADGLFRPKEEMSIAALLALSCRIRAAYDQEAPPQNGESIWYLPYVEYAIAKNIISPGEFTDKYTKAVTRGQAAHILANTLPKSELSVINNVEYLPDVEQTYTYYNDILTLYRAGIVSGSDAQRNFFPSNNITREAVISVAARLTDASKRSHFTLSESGKISTNFAAKRVYSEGVFTDIAPADWYYKDIKTLYEYGLAEGMGNKLFAPKGNISIASVIVLACRLHAGYYGSTAPQNGDMVWYMPYVEYAIGAGIISADAFSGRYTQNATRGEVAYILARTLPAAVMTSINSMIQLSDVPIGYPYYNDILYLYNCGIVTGKNSQGDFYPDDNITRAEVMTMLTRMIHTKERKQTAASEPQNKPQDEAQTEQQIISEMLRLINSYREQEGLTSVMSFPEINQAAQTRAQEIAELREHIRPNEMDFFTVLDEYSISYTITAENIACGPSTPLDAITAWMNSDLHRSVILHPDFTMVGLGHYITPYGMHCWVQLFTAN